MMPEHEAPTEADLEDLARRLEAFGDELPPREQAAFRDLLVKAAGGPVAREADGGGGAASIPDERSVSTASHAENHSADTRFTIPPPRVFYVMGVPVFEY
jgi:hypothetical protein